MKNLALGITTFTLIALFQTPQPALAVGSSGIETNAYGARAAGRANASVADAKDASVLAFNPAGITKLEGSEMYLGSTFVSSALKFKSDDGMTQEAASRSIQPIPYFYFATETPVENLHLGYGANAPFGLVTRYSSVGAFQYIAHYNEVKTMAHTLSLAYELTPNFSFAGGWTYMDATLTQVGKFHSIALTGDAQDAPYEYHVSGPAQGWVASFLWDLDDKQSLGVYYRSELRSHLQGEMSTSNLTGTIAAVFGTGGGNVTSADTDISFPGNVTIGYKYQWDENTDVEFDAGYTFWSSNDSLDTVFGTSNAILAGFEQIHRDWHDTLSLHVGASHRVNENHEISWGYSWYQRAIGNATYTNEVPDGNRHNFNIGLQTKLFNWDVDFSYGLVLVGKMDVENIKGNTNGTDIDGEYSGVAHIISAALKYEL